ncbi:MAG: cobalamin-binding protein [Burkholderiales bacterium]
MFTLLIPYAHALSLADDRGQTVELNLPAQRIIALAPFITELVYAAGAGSRLVGVSAYSDYPDAAKNILHIGDAAQVDIERILELKPDLIVGWRSGSHARELTRLEKLGFKVFVMEPLRLSDIPRLLRALGQLAATEQAAQSAAGDFEHKLELLRKRYSHRRPVSVFYEIWHQPLMTVNGAHMISDALQLCGGVNVFAGVRPLTPIVSIESLLAADPQVIISGVAQEQEWRQFGMLSAVRRQRIFFVPPEWLGRQSPRILDGAREICQRLDKVRQQAD